MLGVSGSIDHARLRGSRRAGGMPWPNSTTNYAEHGGAHRVATRQRSRTPTGPPPAARHPRCARPASRRGVISGESNRRVRAPASTPQPDERTRRTTRRSAVPHPRPGRNPLPGRDERAHCASRRTARVGRRAGRRSARSSRRVRRTRRNYPAPADREGATATWLFTAKASSTTRVRIRRRGRRIRAACPAACRSSAASGGPISSRGHGASSRQQLQIEPPHRVRVDPLADRRGLRGRKCTNIAFIKPDGSHEGPAP